MAANRVRCGRRLAAAAGAVVEALEARRVLSASVGVEGEVLVIRGTAADDVLVVQAFVYDARLHVVANDVHHTVPMAGLLGIRIEGGDGHDELGSMLQAIALPLPMTVSGGAGDDTIIGGRGRDVLRGGSGEDLIAGEAMVSEGGRSAWAAAARVEGPDTLRGSAAADDFQPEAGDDDFRGEAAELASVRYHKGVLYVTGTSAAERFEVRSHTGHTGATTGEISAKILGSSMDTRYRYAFNWYRPADVTEVRIDGGGGADEVVVMRTGGVALPAVGFTAGGGGGTQWVGGQGVWAADGAGVLGRTDRYGSAVLSDDGVLTVTGTDAGEEVLLGSLWDSRYMFVRMNGWEFGFELSAVREVRVDCGGGDDAFYFWSMTADGETPRGLHVPITVDGGAGDDELCGQDQRNNNDQVIPGPYDDMAVTLRGGEGDDRLYTGVGRDRLEGGAGEDVLYSWHGTGSMDGGAGYDVLHARDPLTGQMVVTSEFPTADDGTPDPTGDAGGEGTAGAGDVDAPDGADGTAGGGGGEAPDDASEEGADGGGLAEPGEAAVAPEVVAPAPTWAGAFFSGRGDAAGLGDDDDDVWEGVAA